MSVRFIPLFLLALVIPAAVPLTAAGADEAAALPPTVEQSYMGLSSGVLRQARLVDLPDDVILRTADLVVRGGQVDAQVAGVEAGMRVTMARHKFFLLEQTASRRLLMADARAWARETRRNAIETEKVLLDAFQKDLIDSTKISDAEAQEYYEANKENFGGASFDSLADKLKASLLTEKKRRAVREYMAGMSDKRSIEVDADWVKTQAALELDNMIDKARRSGKPLLLEFWAPGCSVCQRMEPVISKVKENYADRCTVLDVNGQKDQFLAYRYGIVSVPALFFFDASGKEIYRHTGYMSPARLEARLSEMVK